MSNINFADRYAEAGISPTAAIIELRQASATRISKDIAKPRVLDLISTYYGLEGAEPHLVPRRIREGGRKLQSGEQCAGMRSSCRRDPRGAGGDRECDPHTRDDRGFHRWRASSRGKPRLVRSLRPTCDQHSFDRDKDQSDRHAEPERGTPSPPSRSGRHLGNAWKVRLEEQEAIKSLATQVSNSLSPLVRQVSLMREETQILWWLFGESSRTLNKPFRSFTAPQAAVLAGLELGQLTNVTILGPVAAPAMLERVIQLAPERLPGPRLRT